MENGADFGEQSSILLEELQKYKPKRFHGSEALPILKVLDTEAMHESNMKKITRKKRE